MAAAVPRSKRSESMKRPALCSLSALLLVAAPAQEPAQEPLPEPGGPPSSADPGAQPEGGYAPAPERAGRAVSRSGQFRVSGGDPADRSAGANRSSVAFNLEET